MQRGSRPGPPPLPLRLVALVDVVLLQSLLHQGQVSGGGPSVQLGQLLPADLVRTGGARRGGAAGRRIPFFLLYEAEYLLHVVLKLCRAEPRAGRGNTAHAQEAAAQPTGCRAASGSQPEPGAPRMRYTCDIKRY